MFWFILFGAIYLVVIAIYVLLYKRVLMIRGYVKKHDSLCEFLIGLLGVAGLILVLVFGFVKNIDAYKSQEKVISETRTELVCVDGVYLQLGMSYSSDSVSRELYYFYYEKLDNGGYKLNKKNPDYAVVFEEDRDDGVLIEYKESMVEPSIYTFDWGGIIGTEFHVPVGSIKVGCKIDAE